MEELIQLINKLGLGVSRKQIVELMLEVDKDCSGQVS